MKKILIVLMIGSSLAFQGCTFFKKDNKAKTKVSAQKLTIKRKRDPDAPILTITSPTLNQVFNTGSVTVNITADRLTDYILINGQYMNTTDSLNFDYSYTIPFDGKYAFEVKGYVGAAETIEGVYFEVDRNTVTPWAYEECPTP